MWKKPGKPKKQPEAAKKAKPAAKIRKGEAELGDDALNKVCGGNITRKEVATFIVR
jgi:hypothetical protein